MFSPPSPWAVYREALTPLKFGDALWEPSPIYSYKRVRLGDVGYIRQGRFHLLFSAGIPLGSRVPGTDVPLTFEPLDIGPIVSSGARPPGYLRTDTVRQIGADVGGSVAVALAVEPGARIAFELTSKQGATLITKHPTYREHIERDRRFVNYIKQHYESWINFAREQDYPEDVRPILVTGVDLTQEFATVAYSDNRTRMECEFSATLPAVASTSVAVWGSWNTPGLVHTNCGPDITQRSPGSSESSAPESKIPDEYTQCVFIRYYTVRKRFFIPTVLKAGAGPHQLPKGGHGGDDLGEEGFQVFSADDSTEVDYPETSPPEDVFDEVIHNVPTVGLKQQLYLSLLTGWAKDDRDSFDIVAEFIFQRSDAKSVILHHDDIQDFLQGDEEELTRLLAESGVVERVRVDGNGVGWLPSPTATRSSTPQRPEGWESTTSVLNAAVEALSITKEDPSVFPAKMAFEIVGSILTMIRDTMIDQADYVELGLGCAGVCTALDRRLNGKNLNDLDDSVSEAINQLTRVAAEIHRNTIEQGKGDLTSQDLRAKSNKGNIATWRLNLEKIIQVLNPVPQPPTPTPLHIPGQLKSPLSDDDSDSGSDAGGTLWTISGGTNSTLGTWLTAPQSDHGKSLPRSVVNTGVPQHHQQRSFGPTPLPLSDDTNSTLGTRISAPQSDRGKSLLRLVIDPGVPQHHQQRPSGPRRSPQSSPSMSPEYSPATRRLPKQPTKLSGSYNRTNVFDEDFRPPAEEIHERLGDFFPGHDLDEPVIETSSGGTSLTSAEAAKPFPIPDGRMPKKSIRVVADEHKRELDRTSMITSANNVNMSMKRSVKLWGSKVEEVTAEQAKNASSALSTPAESPSEPKPTFRLIRGKLIGKGTYGKVYVALNATTGETIAVKQVKIPRKKSGRNDSRQVTVAEALKLESETLKDLDHQNVVQYLGFEETSKYLSIFLEYVPGGSIASILRKHGRFDENVTKLFTSQILDGLDYLHSKGVIHRDLKADNILVEEFGHCKITDFGISKRTDDINMIGAYASMRGSAFWMAPEVVNSKNKGYNSKIDIWSVGCVVLEMWTGERPWSGQGYNAVLEQLRQSKVGPPFPGDLTLSHQADDLRKRCFAINPDERPTAGELRQHPYLTLPLGWEFTGYS